jgi:hypothetical protein
MTLTTGQGQNQPCTENVKRWQRPRLRPPLQFAAIFDCQYQQLSIIGHIIMTYDNRLRYDWDTPLAAPADACAYI